MSNKVDHVDESEERLLNDDYKNWKKSVSFLYDMVMTHALHWPSNTLEWLPSDIQDGKVEKSRLLFGATTDSDKSQVLLADVYLPNENDLDPNTPFGTYKPGLGKIEIQRRIPHQNAVTRARHMPQRPQLIATTSSNGDINVFDIDEDCYSITDSDREDLGAIPDDIYPALLRLRADCGESSTLSWNLVHPGYLLSVDRDRSVKLWDVCHSVITDEVLNHLAKFEGHSNAVTDVSWWNQLTTVFLSGSTDGSIGLWDIRSRCRTRPSHMVPGHKNTVTSVAPSPFSRHLFASGSEDGTVALWDVRYLSVKLHSLSTGLKSPRNSVSQVCWSPHQANLVASSSASRTVTIWDLDVLHDIERQQRDTSTTTGQDYDPPELVFMHGGHSSLITDFGWHPSLRNVIASTANDNIVHVWRPMDHLMTGCASKSAEGDSSAMTVTSSMPQVPVSVPRAITVNTTQANIPSVEHTPYPSLIAPTRPQSPPLEPAASQ